MNVGSLFSGIGGIELGFEREGFTTKWFVEWDEYCQAVLRKNFKGAKIYGDIQKINFDELEKVDILTGGFPCQDISVAGKGKGIIEGKRSSLWKHFHRAIGEIRPKYAVIENVSALTFRGLCNVLADLAEIGYDAEWVCLRASDFGALHRRERIFIIAYSNGNGCDESNSASKDLETGVRKISEGEQVRNRRFDEPASGVAFHSADSIGERHGGRSAVESKEGDGAETQGRADASQESAVANAFGFELREKSQAEERFVADDWSERVQRFREESLQGGGGFSWCKDARGIEDLKGRPDIPEPLVRGGRDGFPKELDKEVVNYVEKHDTEAKSKIDEFNRKILRELWEHRESTKTSSGLYCPWEYENFVSDLPQELASGIRFVGERIEEEEELCGLWQRICATSFEKSQDLQQRLLERIREIECEKTMERKYRVDRTRACGNAVVPQCAQFIARQIKERQGLKGV